VGERRWRTSRNSIGRSGGALADRLVPIMPVSNDSFRLLIMLPLLAESYLHRLDPFVFRLTETAGVRWYGLAYLAGFLIAWGFFRWMGRTGRSPLSRDDVADWMMAAIIGVLVGGRVGYAVFYDPTLLIRFSASFPWWDLLALNKGGMASHGGIIGFIAGTCWFALRRGHSALHLLDMGGFISGVGLSIGRVTNFVNAELGGRPWSGAGEAPWWTVKYPQEILSRHFEHMDQLYRELGMHFPGRETFARQVVTAAMDGDEHVLAVLRPLLTPYYPSQLVQAFSDGPVLVSLLALIWIRPRRPGVIGAWFLTLYSVLRIATEFVRQPDDGVALLMGLSRGQVLSVVMVVVGVCALIIVSRRDVRPVAGWRSDAVCRGGSTKQPAH